MLKILLMGPLPEMDWAALGCGPVFALPGSPEDLERISPLEPDLILFAMEPPACNGLELLRKYRASGGQVPCIVVAPRECYRWVLQALRLGAQDYLTTPFDTQELLAALDRIRPPEIPMDAQGNKYVREAMAYIARHYADTGISIAAIAGSLQLSEGHLSHMFKKETGSTVNAYLTQVRMTKAMELLSDCRRKIYEVAELVGYRDVAYFSATFKKATGVSPSNYQSGRPSCFTKI